jgi:hypothetical protein
MASARRGHLRRLGADDGWGVLELSQRRTGMRGWSLANRPAFFHSSSASAPNSGGLLRRCTGISDNKFVAPRLGPTNFFGKSNRWNELQHVPTGVIPTALENN